MTTRKTVKKKRGRPKGSVSFTPAERRELKAMLAERVRKRRESNLEDILDDEDEDGEESEPEDEEDEEE